MWLGYSKKWWAIATASFVCIVLITFIGLTIANRSDSTQDAAERSTSNSDVDSDGSAGGEGTGLTGSKVGVSGSVVSTRNLKGMLAQINQIDICEAPDLKAYITVTAEDASAVSKLTKNDFKVYVDGKESKDFSLELVSKKNLSMQSTLIIDRSGSMRGEPMQKAKEAAIAYVNGSNTIDKTSIIQFGTTVETRQGFTTDKTAAINAINAMQAGTDTALYDAINTAANQAPQCGRKAIIALSDGGDTASKSATLEAAIQRANAVNTPVFVVGLKSSDFTPDILRSIAEKTGAQYFEAPTPADLGTMYQKISNQIGNQYYLSFKLNINKTGGEHRLKITSTVEGSPTTSERSFVY